MVAIKMFDVWHFSDMDKKSMKFYTICNDHHSSLKYTNKISKKMNFLNITVYKRKLFETKQIRDFKTYIQDFTHVA